MSFLLDTNVISEPMKPRPNAGVLAWLAEVDEDSVFLSVVTITELRYGIERLATGRRRDHLDRLGSVSHRMSTSLSLSNGRRATALMVLRKSMAKSPE